MRVATAQAMARIDRETIASGVPGEELMERAGRETARRLLDLFPDLAPPAKIVICCGKGNNGGDGLVMARLLDGLGFQVTAMTLALPAELSPDARLNHGRLPSSVRLVCYPPAEWPERWLDLCAGAALTIDAVFGTGISPPLREPYVSLLRAINTTEAPILSVDVPSGVDGDTGQVDPVAVRATATVTIGLPKLGLLLPPGRDHVGELAIVDIGFVEETIARLTPDRHLLSSEDYAALLPRRPSDGHKYRMGTVLVLAGSRAFGGAAVLAGMGALRSGAGLVTVAVPDCLEIPTRTALPEALIRLLPTTAGGGIAPVPPEACAALLARQHAVAVGPGLGDDPLSDAFVVAMLDTLEAPAVIDADAFTAYGRLGRQPSFSGASVVLTPHAGELARVLGLHPAEVERRRLDLVPELAERWGAVLLLKGSPAVIAAPSGGLHFNPTGDDGLAHGGTGDVLTGLIGGLLAQGCAPLDAALLGAYLHGRAAVHAAADGSRRSLLAREVAAGLGPAFAGLEWLRAGQR